MFLEKLRKIRESRNIKLVTTEKRVNYLGSEPNYYTIRYFTEYLLAIEVKKSRRYL